MKYCECLIGVVGLRDVCETPDGCSLYLDDLPNISREAFALLTDSDRNKISDVFTQIEKRAAALTYLSLVGAMKGNFLKGKATQRILTGQFESNDPLITFPQNKLIGKRIYKGESEYIGVNLEQIYIWSEANITGASFYIFDLYTGLLIETLTADLTAGQVNTLNLDGKKYGSKGDLFIAYNGAEIQSKVVSRYGEYWDTYCYCQCNGSDSCKEFDYTAPLNASNLRIYEDNLDSGTDCGIVLGYSKDCNFEEFICRNIDSGIGLILQYHMGIEFWKEDRLDNILNWFSLIKKEDKFSYRSDLEDGIKLALDNFVQQVDGDEVCFECSKYGTSIEIQIP